MIFIYSVTVFLVSANLRIKDDCVGVAFICTNCLYIYDGSVCFHYGICCNICSACREMPTHSKSNVCITVIQIILATPVRLNVSFC